MPKGFRLLVSMRLWMRHEADWVECGSGWYLFPRLFRLDEIEKQTLASAETVLRHSTDVGNGRFRVRVLMRWIIPSLYLRMLEPGTSTAWGDAGTEMASVRVSNASAVVLGRHGRWRDGLCWEFAQTDREHATPECETPRGTRTRCGLCWTVPDAARRPERELSCC